MFWTKHRPILRMLWHFNETKNICPVRGYLVGKGNNTLVEVPQWGPSGRVWSALCPATWLAPVQVPSGVLLLTTTLKYKIYGDQRRPEPRTDLHDTKRALYQVRYVTTHFNKNTENVWNGAERGDFSVCLSGEWNFFEKNLIINRPGKN